MIGSATSDAPPVPRFWQAGKIRCSASSRFVDVDLGTPGLGVRSPSPQSGTQKLIPAQPVAAPDPSERGSSMIRSATAKRSISTRSSQASCSEMPCRTATMTRAAEGWIEMPRPTPLSLRLRDHRRQHVHGLGNPRKRFALQSWIGKALRPKLHGQMAPSPFLRRCAIRARNLRRGAAGRCRCQARPAQIPCAGVPSRGVRKRSPSRSRSCP